MALGSLKVIVAASKLTNSVFFIHKLKAVSVSQFFHILGSVDQQRGCCEVAEGKYEITIYTSCCNADKGIYYYTTYNCHRINAVDMHKVNLDDSKLFAYDVIENEPIFFQN